VERRRGTSAHERQQIHVALVEDPGVLNRIVSKWRQRGFNIESLAVGHSELSGLSRMTFVVDTANTDVTQVIKQVDKLIDVIHISDITDQDMIYRELALIKVPATPQNRSEIIQIVDIFRANIVDVDRIRFIVRLRALRTKSMPSSSSAVASASWR
jgi:acetolactate synthase-1/3 small subunit